MLYEVITRFCRITLPGEVLRSANRIMTGAEVSDIHRDGRVYDVQVWSIPAARQNLVITSYSIHYTKLYEGFRSEAP